MVYVIVYAMTIAIIIATGFILYRLRPVIADERRMKGFLTMSVMALAWMAAATIDMLATPEHFAYTYVTKVALSIIVPYVTGWFFFNFTESKLANSRVMIAFLIAAPAADVIMLITTPFHRLYFVDLDPPVYPNTIPTTGFVFWIHIALIAVSALFIYTVFMRYLIKNLRRYPLLAITGIGALTPFILNIAFVVRLFGLSFDFSAIGYFFTIILFAYFVTASKARNYNPSVVRDAMAAITKSPVLYAGNFGDAAIMISREGCKALDVQCIGVWEFSGDMNVLNKRILYDTGSTKNMAQDSIDLRGCNDYKDLIILERLFAVNDINAPNALSSAMRDYNQGLCAYMDAPIRVSGELYGIIRVEQYRCAAYPERREWTTQEQNFTYSLASFITVAIENAERKRLEAAVDEANKKMIDGIEQRDALLRAVNHVATMLLTTKDDEHIETNLIACMELVGQANSLDRVHIWKNEVIDGKLHHACIYIWQAESISTMKTTYKGSMFAVDEGPRWGDALLRNESIYGPLSKRPLHEQVFVKRNSDLKSLVVIPLFLDDEFWGIFCADDYSVERDFTDEEISILRSVSLMMASAINRHVLIAKRTSEAEELAAKKYEYASKLRDALAEITKSSAISSGNLEESATIITKMACELLNASQVAFWVLLPHVDALESRVSYSAAAGTSYAKEIYDLRFREKYADLLRSERLIVMNSKEDIMENLPVLRECNIEISASLDAPIFIDGKLAGSFGVEQMKTEDHPEGRVWLIEEQNFVSSLADLLALAVSGEERRKARDEAELANKAKSIFLAKMSHEIRTPMNAIIGMTELALREDMPDTIRDHILTARQASANLLSLINDILDFSKIESGTMQITPAEYLLSSLLNDVISIIRIKAFDSQIRFAVNIDSKISNALIGDEVRIRQVLINILGNAVKFTEKGSVLFTITGERTGEDSVDLIFTVRDSGRGIKKEDLTKLFDDYYQPDDGSSKELEGTGLGLSISRNIVSAMKGEITVDSVYGKGSVFTVKIPQKIYKAELIAQVENPESLSVLVYERRTIYADSIEKSLENLGVKHNLASTEKEFLELLKNNYSFVFISHLLFEKNKLTIVELCGNAKIVLLSDFGESVPSGGWSTLSLPVHALSIASILNRMPEVYSYDYTKKTTARFIAPDANVLVVDDIATNLKVANGLLLPYEMNVDLRINGYEAIDAIKEKRYDLVFMDHRMPGIDGVETTRQVRDMGSEDSYYTDVPIIALTANAVSGMKEMFLSNGFNDFMSKPIDLTKLSSVLESFIPKEKRKTYIDKRSPAVTSSSSFYVEGLDVDKGILLTGGTLDYYLETLSTFYFDGQERMNDIAENLESNNIKMFITNVHATKSASANIGAGELSEAANALEMAALQDDIKYINENTDRFLRILKELLERIHSALLTRSSAIRDKGDMLDTEELKALLINLKTALENFDVDGINKNIKTLLHSGLTDDTMKVVRDISKCTLILEYDNAIGLIEDLLE